MWMNHQKLKTLFVKRTLLNAAEVRSWAKSQGFDSVLADGEMHVTIAFSKKAIDWSHLVPLERRLVNTGGQRSIQQFGNAVVLCFPSNRLQTRWQEFLDNGASYDFDEFKPHVSLTFQDDHPELDMIELFTGNLRFGPEHFAEINENWSDRIAEN